MQHSLASSVAVAVLALGIPRVSAEPRDLVTRPIVLANDQIAADVVLAIGLDKGHEGAPISLSPDLWFGLTSAVTVGVIHSDLSLDRIGAGSSISVRRSETTEDRAYHNAGLDVRWRIVDGPLAIAPRARFLIRNVDPWKPAVTAGALVRWTRGRFAVSSDPYLRFGLANLDKGNRTAVVIPLYLAVQPAAGWSLALHTGYNSDLAVATDGFHVPFALIVRTAITAHIDLVVEGGFSSAVGPQNSSGYRTLQFTFAWRT